MVKLKNGKPVRRKKPTYFFKIKLISKKIHSNNNDSKNKKNNKKVK